MKRANGFVCFLLGAVLATVLTVLIGRGQNPDFARSIFLSSTEAALERPLENVRIEGMPFEQAVAELGKRAGIHIVVDNRAIDQARAALKTDAIYEEGRISLTADRIALADALMEAVRQGTNNRFIECVPEGDHVLITARFSPRDPSIVGVYDIRDLIKSGPNDDEKWAQTRIVYAYAGLLAEVDGPLPRIIDSDSWNASSTKAQAEELSGKLVVLQTWAVHRDIRQMLRRLRQNMEPPWPPSETPSNLRVWNAAVKRFVGVDNSSADAALRRQLEHVDIQNRPLSEAFEMLTAQAHVRLTVDWQLLKTSGFDATLPVSFKSDRVTLAAALGKLMRSRAENNVSLGFRSDGPSVYISTASDTASTRIYDVRNFVGPIEAPDFQEKYDALVKEITSIVDPDSWRDYGGEPGLIQIIGSKLVVTQSWQNQEAVERLLSDLMANPGTRPTTQPARQ
jgi:hypothetical protein